MRVPYDDGKPAGVRGGALFLQRVGGATAPRGPRVVPFSPAFNGQAGQVATYVVCRGTSGFTILSVTPKGGRSYSHLVDEKTAVRGD